MISICSLLGLVILLVLGILVVLLARSKAPKVDTPSCGNCGYQVKGLPTFTCPECGADLREAGIITPQLRQPIGTKWRILIWTLLLPIPAIVITMTLTGLLAPRVSTATTTVTWLPESKAYQDIEIAVIQKAIRKPRSQATPRNEVRVDLKRRDLTGPPVELKLQPASMASDEDGFATLLQDWLTDGGVDTADTRVQAEITELAGALQQSGATIGTWPITNYSPQAFASSGQSTIMTSNPVTTLPPWSLPIIAVFWLGVWFFGLRRWCLTKRDPSKPA